LQVVRNLHGNEDESERTNRHRQGRNSDRIPRNSGGRALTARHACKHLVRHDEPEEPARQPESTNDTNRDQHTVHLMAPRNRIVLPAHATQQASRGKQER
jgi:hypothetical protein